MSAMGTKSRTPLRYLLVAAVAGIVLAGLGLSMQAPNTGKPPSTVQPSGSPRHTLVLGGTWKEANRHADITYAIGKTKPIPLTALSSPWSQPFFDYDGRSEVTLTVTVPDATTVNCSVEVDGRNVLAPDQPRIDHRRAASVICYYPGRR
jgi:hypothetical protein